MNASDAPRGHSQRSTAATTVRAAMSQSQSVRGRASVSVSAAVYRMVGSSPGHSRGTGAGSDSAGASATSGARSSFAKAAAGRQASLGDSHSSGSLRGQLAGGPGHDDGEEAARAVALQRVRERRAREASFEAAGMTAAQLHAERMRRLREASRLEARKRRETREQALAAAAAQEAPRAATALTSAATRLKERTTAVKQRLAHPGSLVDSGAPTASTGQREDTEAEYSHFPIRLDSDSAEGASAPARACTDVMSTAADAPTRDAGSSTARTDKDGDSASATARVPPAQFFPSPEVSVAVPRRAGTQLPPLRQAEGESPAQPRNPFDSPPPSAKSPADLLTAPDDAIIGAGVPAAGTSGDSTVASMGFGGALGIKGNAPPNPFDSPQPTERAAAGAGQQRSSVLLADWEGLPSAVPAVSAATGKHPPVREERQEKRGGAEPATMSVAARVPARKDVGVTESGPGLVRPGAEHVLSHEHAHEHAHHFRERHADDSEQRVKQAASAGSVGVGGDVGTTMAGTMDVAARIALEEAAAAAARKAAAARIAEHKVREAARAEAERAAAEAAEAAKWGPRDARLRRFAERQRVTASLESALRAAGADTSMTGAAPNASMMGGRRHDASMMDRHDASVVGRHGTRQAPVTSVRPQLRLRPGAAASQAHFISGSAAPVHEMSFAGPSGAGSSSLSGNASGPFARRGCLQEVPGAGGSGSVATGMSALDTSVAAAASVAPLLAQALGLRRSSLPGRAATQSQAAAEAAAPAQASAQMQTGANRQAVYGRRPGAAAAAAGRSGPGAGSRIHSHDKKASMSMIDPDALLHELSAWMPEPELEQHGHHGHHGPSAVLGQSDAGGDVSAVFSQHDHDTSASNPAAASAAVVPLRAADATAEHRWQAADTGGAGQAAGMASPPRPRAGRLDAGLADTSAGGDTTACTTADTTADDNSDAATITVSRVKPRDHALPTAPAAALPPLIPGSNAASRGFASGAANASAKAQALTAGLPITRLLPRLGLGAQRAAIGVNAEAASSVATPGSAASVRPAMSASAGSGNLNRPGAGVPGRSFQGAGEHITGSNGLLSAASSHEAVVGASAGSGSASTGAATGALLSTVTVTSAASHGSSQGGHDGINKQPSHNVGLHLPMHTREGEAQAEGELLEGEGELLVCESSFVNFLDSLEAEFGGSV